MNNETIIMYTLDEAREIIHKEQAKQKAKRLSIFKQKIKQKMLGIAMIGISILIPILLKDITVSVFTLALGAYLLLTKEKLI